MIEVFKTGVCNNSVAIQLVREIERRFPGYKANFDLEDCDHILRVSAVDNEVNAGAIIDFLNKRGFDAEPLADEVAADPEAHSRYCNVHPSGITKGAAPDFYRNLCLHLRRISEN